MGLSLIGNCEGQDVRKPGEKVSTITNALPEAIVYDIDDGSIELVYSCEYIPYVVNVPGAPDTEWAQLRNLQQKIVDLNTGELLARIPTFQDPFVQRGVAYNAQQKWETYHRNCKTIPTT